MISIGSISDASHQNRPEELLDVSEAVLLEYRVK